MPSYAAIAPVAQHRGREPQLACDLHQWPTAACQQGDRLRLELIRKMTPFLAHSTPSRSSRSLPKVSTNSGEVLIEQVRRDWPSVIAVRGSFEPPLRPSPQAVVAHQPGYPAATDHQAGVLQFPRHPGTAVSGVREGKGRPDMRQQHHVVALAAAG